MVLVDTSVWVEHLSRGQPALAQLLMEAAVLIHPFVVGELACGNPEEAGKNPDRSESVTCG